MTTIALDGQDLNIGEIEKAHRKKLTSYKCAAVAGKIKQLSNRVENHWNEFSDREREVLKDLAYSISEPAKIGFFARIRLLYKTFQAHQGNYYTSLEMVGDSIDELVDNILSAIEREDLARACTHFDEF